MRIFTSQDNLINGRGRFRRRLEARLDEQETKSVGEITSKSGLSSADTLGDNSELYTLLSPQEPLLFCDYITDCNKACFQGTDKYNLCMIRKFKDKYKNFDYGRQMGI